MTFVQSLELGLDFTPLLAQRCTAAVGLPSEQRNTKVYLIAAAGLCVDEST